MLCENSVQADAYISFNVHLEELLDLAVADQEGSRGREATHDGICSNRMHNPHVRNTAKYPVSNPWERAGRTCQQGADLRQADRAHGEVDDSHEEGERNGRVHVVLLVLVEVLAVSVAAA